MFDANMDHVHVLHSPFSNVMILFDLSLPFLSIHLLSFCSQTHSLTNLYKQQQQTRRKLMQFYLYDIGSDYSSLANVIYCAILFDVYCKIAFFNAFGAFVLFNRTCFQQNLRQFRKVGLLNQISFDYANNLKI